MLAKTKSLEQDDVTLSSLARLGSFRYQILGFFGDKFLGIECTLEAETLVSNLTQYKLFIGDDKKNSTLFGVTFSFKYFLEKFSVLAWYILRPQLFTT